MSIGVTLVLAMLFHLLADALLRLGCPGIVVRQFAGPGATAFARRSHSPVKLERRQSAEAVDSARQLCSEIRHSMTPNE